MTTDLISELGKQPIPGADPVGSEVREEPAFELLEAELAKLSSAVNSPTMDWNKVTQLAAELLGTKGKDLLVACYLTAGLLETRGLYGLADGLKVVGDLVQTYWDTLYPPLKRMRGRRNALQWLIDRVQQRATETDWASLPPQEGDLVAQLNDRVRAIDAVVADKDSEAPSVRTLLSLINSLTVAEVIVAPPEPEPGAAAPAPAAGATGEAAPPPATLLLDSASNVERALEDACSRMGSLAEWFLANDSSNPLSYRLNRTAAWSTLEALPPADAGQTRLPPPISQVTDALVRLKDSQADAELVQFAEAQLAVFPFWLDLNAICAAALGRMGSGFASARQEVCNETSRLLARLPGLEQLSFAGGMPFADGDTQDWLATLGIGSFTGSGRPAASGRERDEVTAAIRNARSLAANDDLASAAACLQDQLALHPSAREQLLLQIRLCELLLEHRPGAMLKAFAQTVVESIDRHELTVWDPAMALDGLKVAYGVMTRDEEDRSKADALLARIVGLDAGMAVKLVT
ncbi:type VI secretion system protein VasJ [Polaromonas sp. YR568]|uniref:type VI secretion system protein TssA n=1 Tax=Polaromonas sp. YR568 TaxID=1855301 RepID=UPI0008F21104|nr:type VI secretion system protein TssA [Polaromonas sp. YR568]SFU61263.1 type VI secretion system protein VasJ [Polaromonas sp. YR568]